VDLTNEVVNVSWSGFRPTTQANVYTVIILQCRANPTSIDDCYTAQPFPDLANGNRLLDVTASDGTGSAQFEVRPASNLPQLACSATTPCSILVYENDAQPILPGTLPAAHVVIPITFAPSQADCPNIVDFDVRVDGSATSAGLFYSWAARICQGSDSVVVDYTETSSTTGRENFLAGLVDIGVTAMPATEEELSHHPDHRDYSYAPVAASAMVVAYNMTDPFTGQRIENLVLSPRLVARLVTNTSIETFVRDRELLNLNPTVRFPTNGVNRILVRAERAASASILTAWFAADPEACEPERALSGLHVSARCLRTGRHRSLLFAASGAEEHRAETLLRCVSDGVAIRTHQRSRSHRNRRPSHRQAFRLAGGRFVEARWFRRSAHRGCDRSWCGRR
jgi:hypothetical protein